MRKKRVLIVDDNFAVRSMVRQVFELEPEFEVSGEAENGIEALQKAATLKPDLIILDLSMPLMTGLDAAPQLMEILPAARIILFTVEEGNEVERLAARRRHSRRGVKTAGGFGTGFPGPRLIGLLESGRRL